MASRCVATQVTIPAPSSLRIVGYRADVTDLSASPATLVLRRRNSDEEYGLPLDAMTAPQAGDGRVWFTATVDVDARLPLDSGTWDIYVDSDHDKRRRLESAGGPTVGTTHPFPLVLGTRHEVRPYVTVKGNVSLTVRDLRSWAEAEIVWSRDAAVTVSGRLVNVALAAASTSARLVLRDRLSEEEIAVPATLDGEQFEVAVELAMLSAAERPDKQVWDLWLRVDGAEDLRLGGHLDDIKTKKKVMIYPAQVVPDGDGTRRIRPYFTVDNNLAMTSNRVPPAESPTSGSGLTPIATPVGEDDTPS